MTIKTKGFHKNTKNAPTTRSYIMDSEIAGISIHISELHGIQISRDGGLTAVICTDVKQLQNAILDMVAVEEFVSTPEDVLAVVADDDDVSFFTKDMDTLNGVYLTHDMARSTDLVCTTRINHYKIQTMEAGQYPIRVHNSNKECMLFLFKRQTGQNFLAGLIAHVNDKEGLAYCNEKMNEQKKLGYVVCL